METSPIHFIDEPVEVFFTVEPVLEKDPPCPQRFRWRGEEFIIVQELSEWRDYQRRGKMQRNMAPEHAQRAKLRGSWGVGRFYFLVKVTGGQIFELYYDRAPQNASDRKGKWFLRSEHEPT